VRLLAACYALVLLPASITNRVLPPPGHLRPRPPSRMARIQVGAGPGPLRDALDRTADAIVTPSSCTPTTASVSLPEVGRLTGTVTVPISDLPWPSVVLVAEEADSAGRRCSAPSRVRAFAGRESINAR
jgi:hypothetical protein